MTEEHDSVQLQVANRHNQPLRFAHMTVAGYSDFTNADAAVICLRLNPEVMTNDQIFQIVQTNGGAVVMDDGKIRDEVWKR
jgi:hypothetical protein